MAVEAGTLGSDELQALISEASQNRTSNLNYAGEVSPRGAFDYLRDNQAVLVDVRTVPEWQFVGVPDLAETKSQLINLSWKIYPAFTQNPNFVNELAGISCDTPLFFICRSGGRSLDAAVFATAAGYKYCFNVSGGFEGDVDANGHRSTEHGWKHDNLPWVQG